MAVQGDVEGDEMLAEWSRDLEAVLYEQEVEEAIREVCPPFTTAPLESFLLSSRRAGVPHVRPTRQQRLRRH